MPCPSSSTERLCPATHALGESAYFAPAPQATPSPPPRPPPPQSHLPSLLYSASDTPHHIAPSKPSRAIKSDYAYDLQAPHRDNISITSLKSYIKINYSSFRKILKKYDKPGEASPFFDHTAVRAIRRHVQGDADRPDDADTGPGRRQVCHTGDLHLAKQVAQLFGSEQVGAGDAVAGVTLKEDEVAEAKLGFRVTQTTPCATPARVILRGELHHDRPVAVRVVGVRVLGRIHPRRRRGGSSTTCTTAIRPSQQVRDRLGHIGNREQEAASHVRCLPPSPCRARHILSLVHVVLPSGSWLGLVPSVSYQLHPSLSPQLASHIVIAPALHHTPPRPPFST
ncbi:hypothetical protein FB451DRAFT_1422472 [Mycena latifolia]|nr:hypothetical protein FB451DRAFT_1422472 [Mycena latifolia]